MGEPPLGLVGGPYYGVVLFFDLFPGAPTTGGLLLGLYEKAIPALVRCLQRHLADTNRLADAPTVRVCRFALVEMALFALLVLNIERKEFAGLPVVGRYFRA